MARAATIIGGLPLQHGHERDELEPVDVDETAVRDLQRRDHGECEEGERQERGRTRPAEPVGGLVRGEALLDHRRERRVRQEAGDGKRALRDDPAVVDHDDAPADRGEVADGERQVVVAHPDDDEVVGVVRDRGRERAVRQPRSRDEAEPDPPGREVPLDDGDLGEAGIGAGDGVAVDDDRLPLERLRHDLVLDQADRADRGSVRGDLEVGCRDRLHPHGLAHPLGHGRRRHIFDRAAVLEHELGREAHEVG